jgi:hypothetical protein
MLGQRDGDVSKCNAGTAVRVLVVPPCDALEKASGRCKIW